MDGEIIAMDALGCGTVMFTCDIMPITCDIVVFACDMVVFTCDMVVFVDDKVIEVLSMLLACLLLVDGFDRWKRNMMMMIMHPMRDSASQRLRSTAIADL